MNTPILILSELNSVEDRIKMFQSGADDYVTKPFNTEVLEARVRTAVRIKRAYDIIQARNRRLTETRQQHARDANSSMPINERLQVPRRLDRSSARS